MPPATAQNGAHGHPRGVPGPASSAHLEWRGPLRLTATLPMLRNHQVKHHQPCVDRVRTSMATVSSHSGGPAALGT
jgi:hypothetical protein